MPSSEGTYIAPKKWGDISDIGNGDCADWINAIRCAVIEREGVMHGVAGTTNPPVPSHIDVIATKGVELYSFAKAVESFLDNSLSVKNEYPTVRNPYDPVGEAGYWVDQNQFLKTTVIPDWDYVEDRRTTKTVLTPNFLTVKNVLSCIGCDYKAALHNIGHGSPVSCFVPFFEAAKNVLNKMTVAPVTVKAREVYNSMVGPSLSTLTGAKQWVEDYYDGMLSAEPYHVVDPMTDFEFLNYSEIDVGPSSWVRFMGEIYWHAYWFAGIANKLPLIDADLYKAYYGEPAENFAVHDVYEYGWDSRYVATYDKLGTCKGITHDLEGGITAEWPPGRIKWPSTPGYEETALLSYILHVYFFADFGIENGFSFRQ